MKNAEELKDKILSEYKKGNIVVSTFDGIKTAPLKDVINQPTEGLLYDINRDQATILTLIDDPKWVNDYACMAVIRELKRQLNELEQFATIREKETKNEILKLIPTTWLDPLLSGDKAINVPAGCPDIEKLLQAIKDRIDQFYTKHKEQ